jgi:hypothetical protein
MNMSILRDAEADKGTHGSKGLWRADSGGRRPAEKHDAVKTSIYSACGAKEVAAFFWSE